MFSDSIDSIPFNFVPQIGDRVDLDAAGVDRAVALSQTLPEAIRWQSYLALLALEGFATWLEDLAIPVRFERSHTRLLQPTQFDMPAAITHGLLNQLRVCLVAISEDTAAAIELPITVIEEPSQTAHLYVAITVDDEQRQAEVQCFIRYDHLVDYRQQTGLVPTLDQTYLLPREVFDADLHHLLLFATGLQPSAIALPTSPSLLSLPAIQQILLQPVVNTANWARQQIARLTDEFNQLADEFVFPGLVPAMQTASPLRSSDVSSAPLGESLIRILRDLQQQGYEIPEQVCTAYQDMVIDNQEIRLSIVTWQLTEANLESPNPEWSLLVILEVLRGVVPSQGIQVTIQDQQSLEIRQTLLPGVAYQVAQAIGELHERFTITISLPSGNSVTLPSFTFQV